MRSHHTSRLFKVVSPPKRPFPWFWDKSWNPSGNCEFNLVRDIVLDTSEGPVKVKAIRYADGRSITIWLDEDHLMTNDQLEAHEDRATELSILISKEIQALTGMQLALPEVMQATHHAMKAPPGVWLDHSDGPELETNRLEVASLWLNLDKVIDELKKDIQDLKDNQLEIVSILQDMTKAKGQVPPPTNDMGVAYR